MALLAISPYERGTWLAENLPVMIAAVILTFTYKRFQFSNTSYCLMWFFICVHTIGGHYSFARVPFEWGNQLLAMTGIDSLFPDGRNNFDRVAHFLIGVFAYPAAELAYRKQWISNIPTAIAFGIFALGFWGALYEVIEMIYAELAGGEHAEDFLGSQGDFWDAQKDMALDILGAVFATVFFWATWANRSPNHLDSKT
ncbi:MAG: putative membrane protein [Neolewinella sp.]|jgi:putative membrane protein